MVFFKENTTSQNAVDVFPLLGANETRWNATNKIEEMQTTSVITSRLIIIGITLIFSLLIIFFNYAAVYTLARERFFDEVRFIFLCSLSLSDLGIGICYVGWIVMDIISIIYHRVSYLACLVYFGIIAGLFLFVSAYSMVALTADMYIKIVHPLRYYSLVDEYRAKIVVAIIWVIGFSLGILIVAVGTEDGWTGILPVCIVLRVINLEFILLWDILNFVLPLVALAFMYVRLFTVARRHIHQIQAAEMAPLPLSSNAGNSHIGMQSSINLKAELRSAVTALIIVGSFFFMYAPCAVLIVTTKVDPSTHNRILMVISSFMVFSTSLKNYFIYTSRIEIVKKALRKTLGCGPSEVVPFHF